MAASEPTTDQTSADASDILADFEHTDLTPEQKRMLMMQISSAPRAPGATKQDSKFVLLQKDKTVRFEPDSIAMTAVVYFKANRNCNFTVDSRCTKVFIEDCHDCTFTFNDQVITGVFEVWKCENSTIHFNTKALTVQADLNKNVHFVYRERPFFHFLVWAGCEDMLVRFIKENQELPTGLSILAKLFPDLIPDVDQFKVSFVNDKLITERIVRLPGGYPSTDREADAFDAQVEKNDKIYLEHVRQLVKENPELMRNLKAGSKASGASTDKSKIKCKPNAPCPCKSGKKFKVCCGDPKLKNPKKMSVEQSLQPGSSTEDPGAHITSSDQPSAEPAEPAESTPEPSAE